MPKKNSLKLVPFGLHRRPVGDFGDADFHWTDVPALLEFTWGKPGEQQGVEWRPNEPFAATLRLDRLERGRSAARFWFVDEETGIQYPFFGQGLTEMLSQVTLRKGVVTGTWIAVKRGSNYGIELYDGEVTV